MIECWRLWLRQVAPFLFHIQQKHDDKDLNTAKIQVPYGITLQYHYFYSLHPHRFVIFRRMTYGVYVRQNNFHIYISAQSVPVLVINVHFL